MTTAHWFLLAFALYLATACVAAYQRAWTITLLAAGPACTVIPTALTTR